MPQRKYAVQIDYAQMRLEAGGANVAITLPKLENDKIRRLCLEVTGWRFDAANEEPHLDSNVIGGREWAVTRDSNSGTPTNYAPSVPSPGIITPTAITNQNGGASWGPCDAYDDIGFGQTANGLSPLAVTYQAGAGGVGAEATAGIDQLLLSFNPDTADQDLIAYATVRYTDFDITNNG